MLTKCPAAGVLNQWAYTEPVPTVGPELRRDTLVVLTPAVALAALEAAQTVQVLEDPPGGRQMKVIEEGALGGVE